MTTRLSFMLIVLVVIPSAQAQTPGPLRSPQGRAYWYTTFNERLPEFGHRNWIAIVDSAYPAQTSPGIETVLTRDDQLEVVRLVLGAFSHNRHVRPIVYVDAELQHVPDDDAPGIDEYRAKLDELLEKHEVKRLPHAEIIEALDTAGQTYRVLVLKTNLELPYTSVFIELDCGYWSAEAEARLREAIESEGD